MEHPEVFLRVTGPQGQRTIRLDPGAAWTIGRSSQHPVVLNEELVSRNHALIQCAPPGEYYLIDLGSRNGSYVNGARVSVPVSLHDGDSIAIGESVLVFHSNVAGVSLTQEAGTEDIDQTISNLTSRLLTVMVVDIRDFTKIAQQVEQRVLCEAISTWFRRGGKIVQECGSWTQKYIGDAIMGVWLHARESRHSDMSRIIEAYLELTNLTSEVGKQYDFPQPLRIGAGINTGIALVGNTGSASISDFTALGDSVNAAFRIESATRQINADLVVGEKTYERLGPLTHPELYFTSHVVKLKGYDRPTTLWAAELESVRKYAAASAETKSAPKVK
ncbi:MAG TPA: adenylate/guanylate cyclase domain-containing protein [Bryobacteraceae bacterium]|nr:adenylate/guanylate cyclase domain-containing protein [Bryobacteraceae bacterium]